MEKDIKFYIIYQKEMKVKELIKKLNKMVEQDKDIENLKVCISDVEYWTFEVDTVKIDTRYVREEWKYDDKKSIVVMLY